MFSRRTANTNQFTPEEQEHRVCGLDEFFFLHLLGENENAGTLKILPKFSVSPCLCCYLNGSFWNECGNRGFQPR